MRDSDALQDRGISQSKLVEDQQLLEQALRVGGVDSVNNAMDKLRKETPPIQEPSDVGAPPAGRIPANDIPAET